MKLGFGSSLPTGVTAGSTNEATVSITDDDVPSVTVSFEQDLPIRWPRAAAKR